MPPEFGERPKRPAARWDQLPVDLAPSFAPLHLQLVTVVLGRTELADLFYEASRFLLHDKAVDLKADLRGGLPR